jgi:hypothetical protein
MVGAIVHNATSCGVGEAIIMILGKRRESRRREPRGGLRPPMRSLGARRRLPALVLAVVWCAAPVLAILHAHSSAVGHHYCAAHRTLEDVIEDQASAPNGDTAVRESGAASAHYGCAFACSYRFDDTVARFALDTAGLIEATPFPTPTAQVASARIAIFVVAPKTSPPV